MWVPESNLSSGLRKWKHECLCWATYCSSHALHRSITLFAPPQRVWWIQITSSLLLSLHTIQSLGRTPSLNTASVSYKYKATILSNKSHNKQHLYLTVFVSQQRSTQHHLRLCEAVIRLFNEMVLIKLCVEDDLRNLSILHRGSIVVARCVGELKRYAARTCHSKPCFNMERNVDSNNQATDGRSSWVL